MMLKSRKNNQFGTNIKMCGNLKKFRNIAPGAIGIFSWRNFSNIFVKNIAIPRKRSIFVPLELAKPLNNA